MTKETAKNKKTSSLTEINHSPRLVKRLQDPEFTSEYLNTAIEEFYEDGDLNAFRSILGTIVKSGNLSKISKESNISRPQLYRMINGKSEINLVKILKLLKVLGYELQIKPA